MRFLLPFYLLLLTVQLNAVPVIVPGPDPISKMRKITTVEHLGRTHFRIRTKTATYFYDPLAGGFSSILDKEGRDWIAYKDDTAPAYPAAAASSYRGLPNLVYQGEDDGAGHPGFAKCESRVVGRNQISTVTLSGEWAWTWTFYPDAARLDVIKAPKDRAYWFLYEGPAGGIYQPDATFWATDLSARSFEVHDHFKGDVYRAQHDLFYFGNTQSSVAFFMAQLTPDEELDHYSLLGNSEEGAAASSDGMIVAGFGRNAGATPLLKGRNSFLIGFIRKDPPVIRKPRERKRIDRLIRRRGKLKNYFTNL